MLCVPVAEFPMPAGPSGAPAAITCHQILFERRLLFVGLATGQIIVFRRRVDSQGVEQIDSKPFILDGHSGLVRCLLLVKQEGLGQDGYLLFSGGADRTVRMWDPSVRDGPAKPCVQTLRGHGGTVTSIAYCEGVLVTASTDYTIKVWKPDEGRELLLYPWFSPQQSIGPLECWVNDIALTMGETGALYVGDEQGGISAYRIERARRGIELTPSRQKPKAHALGIEKLLLVVAESLLISTGYDNVVRLWDAVSGVGVMTIENEHKCRFTALQWDTAQMTLLLGDDLVRTRARAGAHAQASARPCCLPAAPALLASRVTAPTAGSPFGPYGCAGTGLRLLLQRGDGAVRQEAAAARRGRALEPLDTFALDGRR